MLDFSTLILIVIPVLLLEGFFSGSEIALFSVDRLSLKKQAKQGSKGAERALHLILHPEKVLSTTLLVTSICVIIISSLFTLYFLKQTPENNELITILVTSPIIVLFGEMIPKTIYRRYAQSIVPYVALPVDLAYRIFYPITKILSLYTTRLSKFVIPIEELITGKKRTTRDQVLAMLSYSQKETEIKNQERQMIKRILDFRDTAAKSALIPLVQVHGIEKSKTVKEALRTLKKYGHTRLPVYSDRIDNIVGTLEVMDVLFSNQPEAPVSKFMKPARYAPETQPVEDVILEMQSTGNEMTIVVDEHGGAVGILTYEDIVEEIVGEIQDEYDPELLNYRKIDDSTWVVQARAEIEILNESLKLALPQGDYETLSGFLLQQFGRIPEARDELYFDTETGSYKFIIRTASSRRIESVTIEKLKDRNES